MSFVGKILVVVQLVLSVLFMALAGAVFSVHKNWKEKYVAQEVILKEAQKSATDTLAAKDAALAISQKQVEESKALAGALSAQVQNQTIELDALKKENNEDQQELQTQTALALTNSSESAFRKTESEAQRASNRALEASLDKAAVSLRQVEDEKFGLQIELENLKDQYNAGLEQMAYYKKLVAEKGLELDPRMAERRAAPPPPVDGLVVVVNKDRTNRPKYLEISIGSDDGLLTGHVMDVMRTGVGGKTPQYLGKVRIISIEPDRAVCEVVESAKNGIIEKGDNVTTKL